MKKTIALAILLILATPSLLLAEAVVEDNAVTFRYDATGRDDPPADVHVAGSFNGWNGGATEMADPDGDGIYTATLELPDGTHYYKFVVDGNWLTDPTDDKDLREGDNYGGQNSGVLVGPDIRKASPPKANDIQEEFLKHDAVTNARQIENATFELTVRALADDVDKVTVQPWHGTETTELPVVELQKIGTERGFDVFRGTVDLSAGEVTQEDVDAFDKAQQQESFQATRPAVGNTNYMIRAIDGDTTKFVLTPPAPDRKHGGKQQTHTVAIRTFSVPDWSHHAVWYQVFPERFRNGNPDNDPGRFAEYEHLVPWNGDWWGVLPGETAPTADVDNFYNGTGDVWNRRYGGDLQGLEEELPYLQSLGVNAIYLNPIFEAESMHKYDTADYRHVDDNFGVVGNVGALGRSDDGAREYPPHFGEETDDPATWVWSPSDKVFLDFIAAAHEHDMKVVIDGVFNHVGRAHPFFQDVLKHGRDSPYADWFEITDWGTGGEPGQPGGIQYNAWDKKNGALPVLKKDPELGLAKGPREHIFNITRRWLDPDGDPATHDGIDGWRLDVPGDIPHPFWVEWRKVVKDANPDAYITGEIWGMAQPWLKGDQFDAVMNYQFAMPTQDFFVDRETAIEPSEYAEKLTALVDAYPRPIAQAQQNLMDSHDTDRLASMFVNPDRPYDGANRPQDNAQHFDGPPYSERPPTAEEWARFKQLVAFQYSFVSAPMTYYGDEAGMWASDDPNNRQPFPWPDKGPYPDHTGFNRDIFNYYQKIIAIRNALPALQVGDVSFPLTDDERDLLMMRRSTDDQTVYVVVNRSDHAQKLTIDVEPGMYLDYMKHVAVAEHDNARPTLTVIGKPFESDGHLTGTLDAWATAILVKQ